MTKEDLQSPSQIASHSRSTSELLTSFNDVVQLRSVEPIQQVDDQNTLKLKMEVSEESKTPQSTQCIHEEGANTIYAEQVSEADKSENLFTESELRQIDVIFSAKEQSNFLHQFPKFAQPSDAPTQVEHTVNFNVQVGFS